MNIVPLTPIFLKGSLDSKYMEALENFQGVTKTFQVPQELTERMMERITRIAIIYIGIAIEQRQYYSEWSLNELSCHIMQNLDMEVFTDTPRLIQEAKYAEKGFFKYILFKLSDKGLNTQKIEKSALLFSIHRIHAFIPQFVKLWKLKKRGRRPQSANEAAVP